VETLVVLVVAGPTTLVVEVEQLAKAMTEAE
jgi:hypothetical protein